MIVTATGNQVSCVPILLALWALFGGVAAPAAPIGTRVTPPQECARILTSAGDISKAEVRSFIDLISYYQSRAGTPEFRLIFESIARATDVSNPFLSFRDDPRFSNSVSLLVSAGLDRMIPDLDRDDWNQIRSELNERNAVWVSQMTDREEGATNTRRLVRRSLRLPPMLVGGEINTIIQSADSPMAWHAINGRPVLAFTVNHLGDHSLKLAEFSSGRFELRKALALDGNLNSMLWVESAGRHYLVAQSSHGRGLLVFEFRNDRWREVEIPDELKYRGVVIADSGMRMNGRDYVALGWQGQIGLYEVSGKGLIGIYAKRILSADILKRNSDEIIAISTLEADGRFFLSGHTNRQIFLMEVRDGQLELVKQSEVVEDVNGEPERVLAASRMHWRDGRIDLGIATDLGRFRMVSINVDRKEIKLSKFFKTKPSLDRHKLLWVSRNKGTDLVLSARNTSQGRVYYFNWSSDGKWRRSVQSTHGSIGDISALVDFEQRLFSIYGTSEGRVTVVEIVDGQPYTVAEFDVRSPVSGVVLSAVGDSVYAAIATRADHKLYFYNLFDMQPSSRGSR